jgi:hypothetical protein
LAWQWGFAVAAIALLLAGVWLATENMRLRQQVSQIRAGREDSGAREQELQGELERQREAVAKTEQELARAREERERLEAQLNQQQESRVATGVQRAPEPSRPLSEPAAAIASFILMPQMRDVQQIPTVSIPANTKQVSIQLQIEPNDHIAFRVALLNQADNQTVWRSGRLKATGSGDNKTLRVDFDASKLRPQAYLLRVMGISVNGASEIVGDYQFRVVK